MAWWLLDSDIRALWGFLFREYNINNRTFLCVILIRGYLIAMAIVLGELPEVQLTFVIVVHIAHIALIINKKPIYISKNFLKNFPNGN